MVEKSINAGNGSVAEKLNLNKIIGSVNPVGKVAITTRRAEAAKAPNAWSQCGEIPAGTAVLVIRVESKNFVEVIWEERVVFLNTSSLRLVDITDTFKGKSFVVTGELVAAREFYKNLIKLKGGVFKTAVSNNCDYLIVGNPTRSTNSVKLKKAMSLGIKIITEQQFFNLIANGE